MTMTFYQHVQAAADANAPAIADETGRVTYAELFDQVGRAAAVIRERAGAGEYVIVPAQPTIRFVVTLLGVMQSGNTPVPVDPDLPERGVAVIREKSRAVATITALDAAKLAGVQPIDAGDPSRPALILFTSGTSGTPKGVIVSHGNLEHSCRAVSGYLEYRKFPSAAVVLPLHYSYALLSQVCCLLFVGGFVRLFPDLRNPLKVARAVNDEGLETLCGVPSTYHALSVFHRLSPLSMPGVRVLCSAGAAMDRSKLQAIREIFPNAHLYNNYGMTEAAPRISWVRDDDPRFVEGTCGRPMDGVEVRIVDPETHEPLPDGQPGMLVVRGPNITAGYLNEPERTARAFTRDGYLISGDIAYMRGGYIYICGRHDDVFNVGGEKVAPLEIEHALHEIEAVELAAVRGVRDEQRGMAPVAFLKLRGPITRRGVVERLGEVLPSVKIPLQYYEVTGFPMTSNGKIQRNRLDPGDRSYVVREIR